MGKLTKILYFNVSSPESARTNVEKWLELFCEWSGFLTSNTSNVFTQNVDISYKIESHGIGISIDEIGKLIIGKDPVDFVLDAYTYKRELEYDSLGNFYDESIYNEYKDFHNNPYIQLVFLELKKQILKASKDIAILSRQLHPENAKFSLALTHDIDYFNRNFVNRLKLFRNGIKVIKSKIKGKKKMGPFVKFMMTQKPINMLYMKKIEQSLGVDSSCNFSGYMPEEDTLKHKLINPNYDFSKLILDEILNGHFEVGIHGSTRVFKNSKRMEREFKKINDRYLCEGGRQHMLSCRLPDLFDSFEILGYKYDSTMGFNDYNGFRASSGFIHRPIKKNGLSYPFLEIPLLLMDSVFTKSGIVTKDLIGPGVEKRLNQAAELSFCGAVCWHDMAFYKNSDLAESYKEVIQIAQKKGGYLNTAIKIADFFQSAFQLKPNVKDGKVILPMIKANFFTEIDLFSECVDGKQKFGKHKFAENSDITSLLS